MDGNVGGKHSDWVKLTDINIACDAALDQDVNQEIGFLGEKDLSFMEYEEQKEILTSVDPVFALKGPEELMDLMAKVGNNLMFGAIGGMSLITKCMEDVSE